MPSPTTTLQKMAEKAKIAAQNAYAPYSKFHVGACLRSEDNLLFSGANVENASYGLTQCAEASAIGALISAGQKKVTEVVIVSLAPHFCPPCGACRQKLNEFALENTPIHLYKLTGEYKTILLSELLPLAFGPHNLNS